MIVDRSRKIRLLAIGSLLALTCLGVGFSAGLVFGDLNARIGSCSDK